MFTGDSMMTRAGFTVCGVAALGVLFAGTPLSAAGPPSFNRPQDQMQLRGEAAAQAERPAGAMDDGGAAAGMQGRKAGARPETAAGPAQRDPKLEQTRLRLEQELKAQRQMTGDFRAEPDSRRPNMRFGVGYEFRMRGRQELGFDSPGGFEGGGALPGGGNAGGFGNGRR